MSEPYVGPRPFRADEADRFFGRSAESRDTAAVWQAERISVLHGPASSGKTSLLHAGVLPRVAGLPDVDLLPVGRLSHLSAAHLAAPPRDPAYPLLSSWGGHGDSLTEFLSTRRPPPTAGDQPYSILAAVDQVEDLFTGPPWQRESADRLMAALAEALTAVPALRLLLVVRDDHLGTLTSYEDLFGNQPLPRLRLSALDPEAAEEAVTGPASAAGRGFASGAARLLVHQLRAVALTDRLGTPVSLVESHVQPLHLQIACLRLWRESTGTITDADVRRHGDVDHGITAFSDEVIARVAARREVDEGVLRDRLETAFITPYRTRAMVYGGPLDVAGIAHQAIRDLVEAGVLTPEYRAGLTWYQLSHDRLVTALQRANAQWRERSGRAEPAPPPRGPGDYRDAAETALARGDLEAAHEYAGQAVAGYADRERARALVLQGDISRVSGEPDRAKDYFEQALGTLVQIEDTYGRAQVLMAMAELELDRGAAATAADLYREALQLAPGDPDVLAGLGRAQWMSGAPADAEATFGRALDANPGHPAVHAGRGLARVELHQYQAALADLDKALTRPLGTGVEAEVRAARAQALAIEERPRQAQEELNLAISLDPDSPLTVLRSMWVHWYGGDRDAAQAVLRAAETAAGRLPPRLLDQARRFLAHRR
ncbi:tetratricopeptide repeat protein [Nonomuraea sp. NPDC049400]|uniref:tetratricopeptide repeat protein n=1 Tax=Nonomuraea sp. NPDC049400 TaxID=3364352 RepID=UPI00379F093F